MLFGVVFFKPKNLHCSQLPWVSEDDGLFSPEFIERRRAALEAFINKISGHPLAQKERSLHMFLQVCFACVE